MGMGMHVDSSKSRRHSMYGISWNRHEYTHKKYTNTRTSKTTPIVFLGYSMPYSDWAFSVADIFDPSIAAVLLRPVGRSQEDPLLVRLREKVSVLREQISALDG